MEASLRRLNTDWIDLYQLHQPDPLTPIEETLRAFDDLIHQGKVRYIGCSNFTAWQVAEARGRRAPRAGAFVSCQNEYSLLIREPDRELIPTMQAYGMGLLPFFPLASGLLTGKYRRNAAMPEGARLTPHGARYGERFLNERNWPIVERLGAFADQRGRTLLELAFSWLAARPACPVSSPAPPSPSSLAAKCRAAGWALTAEELGEIDRITARSDSRLAGGAACGHELLPMRPVEQAAGAVCRYPHPPGSARSR